MIARVPEAALVTLRKRRIRLEVGARQIGYNQVIIKLFNVVVDNYV
jgi:ribosomal protein L9